MYTRWVRALAVLAFASVAGACYQKRVERIDPNSITDLSGRWNDADSRLVANALIQQSLDAQWARRYSDSHGGDAPAVIVGSFANKTMEHIPVETFLGDLERAFINSQAVRVVASRTERSEIRQEREDQQTNAASDSRARVGRELGAKYMLQGDVQSIEDQEGGERVVYYQIDANLIDLESSAKVWVGQHKIKKYISRRRIGA